LSFSPTGAGVLLAGCICFLAQNALGQVLRPLGASTDDHPVKKYKIEGTVINSVTGEAVPRALVQLMGPAQESVLTGGDGRFHFDAVPEGQVAVTGIKPGFFDQMERKRRYWMQYAITVGPDTKPITVTLVPEGVIHGHVEDVNGEPIENAQIRVTQFRIQEGRKERQEAAYGKTDEEGNFRIADLRQGTYYVGVEANFSRLQNLIEQAKKSREGYPAVVYYPNSPDLSAAQPVNLTPGQRIELQFSLKREPMFHVSGKVTGVPPGMSANFQWLDLTGGALAFANVNASGANFAALGPLLMQVTDAQDGKAPISRFAIGVAQKLCFFANSSACVETDPEFRRVAAKFESGGFNFVNLVNDLFSSPLVTGASDTLTFDQLGMNVSVARRDQLCASLSNRLSGPDICALLATIPTNAQAATSKIAASVAADAFSRGAESPVTPSDPTLFYRSASELLCENVSLQAVDAAGGASIYKSANVASALDDMVGRLMGYPPSDPHHAQAVQILQGHYDAAVAAKNTATNALRSTFVLACESPTALAIGL